MNSVATLAALGFLMHNFMKKIMLHCSCRDLKMVTLALVTLPAQLHDPELFLNLVLHAQHLGSLGLTRWEGYVLPVLIGLTCPISLQERFFKTSIEMVAEDLSNLAQGSLTLVFWCQAYQSYFVSSRVSFGHAFLGGVLSFLLWAFKKCSCTKQRQRWHCQFEEFGVIFCPCLPML